MLKVSVIYVNEKREVPILETLDQRAIAWVAAFTIDEMRRGAKVCEDDVLRTILLQEAQQCEAILRAAGLDFYTDEYPEQDSSLDCEADDLC